MPKPPRPRTIGALLVMFVALAVYAQTMYPGLVTLVLLSDWRRALRPRTMAVMAALTAAGRLAIRVDNYRPFDSHLWLVLGRDVASTARLHASSGTGVPLVTTRSFSRSDARGLQEALAAAGFSSMPLPASNLVEVVHVQVNDNGEFAVLTLDLGGRSVFGLARGTADLNNPRRLTVCAGESM